MRVQASNLAQFVEEIDERGGVAALPNPSDFRVDFHTRVDQNLDPFSETYFAQQVELYRELSGRELDQSTGEGTDFEIDPHAAGSNPYRSTNVTMIAKHLKAILSGLLFAELPENPSILDLGCGWGLSSELFAYCGAKVTAVDINPLFVELVRRRAERLGLNIEVRESSFDAFRDPGEFDLIFFYECLHHALKPWELLDRLKGQLRTGGKILWAGEPVNDFWWRNWGLRLDPISVYCIRKFGWWESGWSEPFLQSCFARAGLQLQVFRHSGLDGGLIGLAKISNEKDRNSIPSVPVSDEANRQIAELHRHIAEMQSSLSWKLSAPIRYAGQLLRKLKKKLNRPESQSTLGRSD